jgi:tRNA pseudouridine38-40 synthase
MTSTFRYFVYLQFKGSNYHGWQIQPNAVTVQEILNQKLSLILNEKIETTGAGRTDTGVHAREFVAHFDCSINFDDKIDQIIYKMNCILPADIAIFNFRMVNTASHARFDAISRKYEYQISTTKNPFLREFSYYLPVALNIDNMNEACKILFDYKDFTSFSKLHTDVRTNLCTISEARWIILENTILFSITSDRFLRNMVRSIVGTLIKLGKEQITLNHFRNIIESKNRCNAGMSAPAEGLFLTKISYPETIFKK